MKLWFAKSTISIAAIIAAREAGLEIELVELDFAKGEQTGQAYLDINPKGRVPALATDRGMLTETGAILEYLGAMAPEARLVPADPWEQAQMRSALHYLASTMHINHAHNKRGYRWASDTSSYEDMQRNVPRTMAQSCEFVETELLRGPWVMGAEFTVADIHLFMLTSWLRGDGVDVAAYPRLAAHFEAMKARPAVQAVIAAGQMPHIAP